MAKWIPAGGFPFGVLRISGAFFLILGLALIGLGVADVVYSVLTYHTQYNCDPATKMTELGTSINPCDNDDIMRYTWAASPIWGGFLIVLCGIIGASLNPNTPSLKAHRDTYAAFAALSSCVVSIAIIVLSSLNINAGKNVFIRTVSGDLEVLDTIKFILPLIAAILALLVMILGIVVIFYWCLCADVYRDDDGRGKLYTYREKSRRRKLRRKSSRQKPQGIQSSAEHPDMVRVPGYPAYANPAYAGYPMAFAPYRPGLVPGLQPYYNQNTTNYQPFRYQNYSSLPNNIAAQKAQLALQQQQAMQRHNFSATGHMPNVHYPTMPTKPASLPAPSSYVPAPSRPRSYKKPGTMEDIDETIDQMFDFTQDYEDTDSGWGGGSSRRRQYIDI